MLFEATAQFGELEAQVFQGPLPGRVQSGARAAEVAERALQVASAQAGERRARGRVREIA
ncbi:MAG: hypothetical protein OXI76_08185 [Gemmatimonadota bacterium]|nr:hypothetical protein [Gemmatimonadota bacterium]